MEVDVEVLDVNDEEARALLLTIDPLAQLADYNQKFLEELRQITETDDAILGALWKSLEAKDAETRAAVKKSQNQKQQAEIPERYQILIECDSEAKQIALLRQLKTQGIACKALTT